MYDVGDIVTPNRGSYQGNRGRVVLRKTIEVDLNGFYRRELVFGVDFEHGLHGRGYLVYFKGNQLERTP